MGHELTEIAFLWPVSPAEPTAAAARLEGFQRAAGALHLSTLAIVPEGSACQLGDKGGEVVRLKLCDSYARKGSVAAMFGFPLSTFRLLRLLHGTECGLVVASTPAPFVPFQALIVSRILNADYVLDVRDSWEMESVTHYGRARNRVKEWLEKTCARSADVVWVVTAMLMERLRERYDLRPAVLELVPNGADLAMFQAGTENRSIDFVFLGSPARYRNVPGVLESVGLVARLRPSLRAVFVGWGSLHEIESENATALDSGVQSNFEFLQPIPRSQAARLLPRAKLGIVSLSGEDVFRGAIGAKAYEYMACGVPLACLGPRGDSELRRLVESRNVGFYASAPSEFAEQAVRILCDEKGWRQLSENCLAASRDFDRTTISKRALTSAIRRVSARWRPA